MDVLLKLFTSILISGSSLPEEGCRTIKVKAAQKGHTQVKASYVYENIKLESTVTIAAYDPLVVC